MYHMNKFICIILHDFTFIGINRKLKGAYFTIHTFVLDVQKLLELQ